MSSGCVSRSSETGVAAVLEILKTCPSLYQADIHDRELKTEILSGYFRISNIDPEIVRRAVSQYLKQNVEDRTYNVQEMFKLHVLNRILFDVPDWAQSNEVGAFGGWIGIPKRNGEVNLSWPVQEIDGEFEFISSNVGYLGEMYMAVEEFDYFRKKYGFRVKSETRLK